MTPSSESLAFARVDPPATPALVLFEAPLMRNLKAMQGLCDAAGVALRAHGKMHKCSTLAKRQIDGGAVGVCAQTVGEAEAFASAGIGDILITSPPPLQAAQRVAALAQGTRIGVVADDPLQVERLGAAARAAGVRLDMVADIDLGQHRTGVFPKAAPALVQSISATGGLRFRGLQGYLGHLQHIADRTVRRTATEAALRRLAALAETLRATGHPPETITGGGTGTHATDLASGVFTELQAGSYAVMDVEYADCDAPGDGAWPFEAALFIAARIVSARRKTHVTVDAGLKALSTDGPPARIAHGAAQGSLWRPMGDEHGAIYHPSALPALKAAGRDPLAFDAAIAAAEADDALPWPTNAPRLGDLVWLQPGHCDPTINLYDAFLLTTVDGRLEHWPIDARRATPRPSSQVPASPG